MIDARVFTIRILGILIGTSLLCAGDLSRYREFQLGMSLPTVRKLAGMNSFEAKVIHQRPQLIQELDWWPGRYRGASADANPVKSILFSFCNGELFRMVVNYDRYETEGLTAGDMVDAISATYGTATMPVEEIISPSIYNESVKVIAKWEDSQHSFNLIRSSYQVNFAMVVFSKRLDAVARAAIIEAVRLDEQEAPQREMERNRKQEERDRAQQEKARLKNKASFRP
jgi:hypothetical protein